MLTFMGGISLRLPGLTPQTQKLNPCVEGSAANSTPRPALEKDYLQFSARLKIPPYPVA